MPSFDDRLTRELAQAARPPEPLGVFERIERRRGRRARARKIRSGALTAIVLVGTVTGFLVLQDVSGGQRIRPGVVPRVSNGSIVYSRVGRTQHLWVVRSDGSGARQLTTGHGADFGPSISPDGRTVAFTRTTPTALAIYTVRIDGTDLTRLTDIQGADPAWSPDGSEIAFAGRVGGVYVMSLQDHTVHLIVNKDFTASSPSWSPNGARIAFAAPANPHGGIRRGKEDIWITDAGGVRQTDITNTPTLSESAPAWSPDGSRILFSRSTPTGSMLMTIVPDPDATLIALTDGSDSDLEPAWSPDGRFIVFERTGEERQDRIYTMRANGSDLTPVAKLAVTPAWQPVPQPDQAFAR